MEMATEGGLEQMIHKISSTQNKAKIIEVFKDIILRSYGEKSLNGRQFIKSKELSEAFSQTPAFSDLFIELATDADAATAFINGIVPQKN